MSPSSKTKVQRLLYLFLFVLTALSVLGVMYQDFRHAEEEFREQTSRYFEDVSRKADSNLAVLSGLWALHRAVGNLDQTQLGSFAREMLSNNPQVASILYAVRVSDAERPRFELGVAIRDPGAESAGQAVRAGVRPVYYPVVFAESFGYGGRLALGSDLFFDPMLRDAIEKASATGAVTASQPIELKSGHRGYVLFKAIYSQDPARTGPARPANVIGLVAVAVDASEMFRPSQRAGTETKVYHFGSSAGGQGGLLYADDVPAHRVSDLLPVFRQQKRLTDEAQPFLVVAQERVHPGIIHVDLLAAVILLCLLVSALMLYIAKSRRRNRRASREAREAIYLERERAEVTLDSIAEGVITTDVQGRIEYLNPVAERLTGWSRLEAKGESVDRILVIEHEITEKRLPSPIDRCVHEGVSIKLNGGLIQIGRSGRRHTVNASVAPIRDHNGVIIGTAIALQDVGESREMSRMLLYQATHDDLTGLLNRREFSRRIQQAIESTGAEKRTHVFAYLDLDQFKVVNDTSGHIAGDSLVKEVGDLLKPQIRESDILARLGGDEFGVLLQDCELEQATLIASNLIEVVRRYRFPWDNKTFEVGVSVGLVPIAAEYQTLTEVMSNADSACYVAKEKGGNRFHVYQPDDDALLKRHGQMQWVHRISRAYSEQRFILYAQEIVSMRKGHDERIYEVLLRMIDESGQLVLPMEYISAAERYQMMADLDRWVINNAFHLVNDYLTARRKDPGLPMKRFAINLSGQSLGDVRTLEFVRDLFSAYPDLPEHIIFEITETAAISSMKQAANFIALFRGMGTRFSLDDFGSGVSSFSYLKNLAVDYLKIDGEFVRDIAYDPINFAMVASINQIGHVMGIKTIAEYVESAEIMERLEEIGVDFGQGNWLSRPGRLSDVTGETAPED